ncbi:hypothetical protein ILYODFUR_026710 [Ilyodon furcidens]|uniref:Uncharacterized protein n=1 Tax=Ilyodon furcidens TaxID=33524 RepID=A0ABV0V7D0_9TELE
MLLVCPNLSRCFPQALSREPPTSMQLTYPIGPAKLTGPPNMPHCLSERVTVKGCIWAEKINLGSNNSKVVYFYMVCSVCGAKRPVSLKPQIRFVILITGIESLSPMM